MEQNDLTLLIIRTKAARLSRLISAVNAAPVSARVSIVGRVNQKERSELRRLNPNIPIIYAGAATNPKAIEAAMLEANSGVIVALHAGSQAGVKQIQALGQMARQYPDSLIAADLSPLWPDPRRLEAEKFAKNLLGHKSTPFDFRPFSGLALSRKLLMKLKQTIFQGLDYADQVNLLPLGSYPDLILRLNQAKKSVMPVDVRLAHEYRAGILALLVEGIHNGYCLQLLYNRYDSVRASGHLALRLVWAATSKQADTLLPKLIRLSWLIGLIAGKVAAEWRRRMTLLPLIEWLKISGISRWKTNIRLLDIELTTGCNMRCFNCDRAVRQAPSAEHISLDQIRKFVSESVELSYPWSEIKILGGEPTTHPQFYEAIAELERLHIHDPKITFIMITNGVGESARQAIERLPDWIKIESSAKSSHINAFQAVNLAPIDFPEKFNPETACRVTEYCGMGLSRYGYFLCGRGASIARVFGINSGIKSLKDIIKRPELLDAQRRELCRLCGSLRDPYARKAVFEEQISPTWAKALADYKRKKPELPLY